jgi:ribosomal protein S27AE
MVKRKITKSRSALDQRASRTWKHLTKDVRHCFRCGELLLWEYVQIEEKNRLVCSECKLIAYQNPKIVGGHPSCSRWKDFFVASSDRTGIWSVDVSRGVHGVGGNR